jgi:pimeloyl-ACP methyl ester carboxylesterase
MTMVRTFTTLIFMLSLVCSQVAQSNPNTSISFQSQEVKFDGGGVKLSGTLLVPKLGAGKPAPALLIISASGMAHRDGVKFGKVTHSIYRDIAEHMAARGMVVLRYDKRCAGLSECKEPKTFEDYVDDALGAMKFLRGLREVDRSRLFLFGHGEGGLIAASAVSGVEEKPAGVVLGAMAGRTLNKVLRDQIQGRMRETGKSVGEINAYLTRYDRVTRGLMLGKGEFPEEKFDPKDPYDAILVEIIKKHHIYISLFINDPAQIVDTVKSPILLLQGKKDILVSARDSQYIEDSLKRVYHPDSTLQLLDNADHLFMINNGVATYASYEDPSRPLDPVMLKVLAEWIEKRSK